MKLVSKVTEIYCIADDFCKEYHSELNKTSLSLSNPSADSPKHRKRKGRMSDAEMITILILFHSNTFRNFKHFYLFYVCRELKKEFPDLLSYTRFVERIPRVAIPLLLFLKLGLMGEVYRNNLYRFYTYSSVRKIRDNPVIVYSKGTPKRGKTHFGNKLYSVNEKPLK